MRALTRHTDATTGVVFIHASPAALCPHVEWALASILEAEPRLKWNGQPAADGMLRATVDWIGPVGTGGRLAAELRRWSGVSFEVTEDPSEGCDGERYSHVPELGLWRGQTGASGDIVVPENRLRALLAAGADSLAAAMDDILGTAWDDALEPLRSGCEGAEVTWLSRVG